jgi:hypothetical protein
MTKIDTRRAAIVRDINALREALGEAALRLEEAGDDPGRLAAAQAQLAQVQHELAGAEAKLVAYDLGLQARAREETARASADVETEVAGLLERIGNLHRSSAARAGRLMRAVESISGEFAALVTDLGEARALTGAAIRLRGGTAALTRLGTNLDGHDLIAASIGPALASSGIGVVGPSLAPWVIVTPPSNAFQPVSLGPALERLHERRLNAIERAATFGKTEAAA